MFNALASAHAAQDQSRENRDKAAGPRSIQQVVEDFMDFFLFSSIPLVAESWLGTLLRTALALSPADLENKPKGYTFPKG